MQITVNSTQSIYAMLIPNRRVMAVNFVNSVNSHSV
jgi:hypothetical protein